MQQNQLSFMLSCQVVPPLQIFDLVVPRFAPAPNNQTLFSYFSFHEWYSLGTKINSASSVEGSSLCESFP